MSGRAPARVCFVFGAQRSGTSWIVESLAASPEVHAFREANRLAYSRRWRLRSAGVRRRLAAASRARWLVFKPLLDVQHGARLLAEHPDSRALFVLRDHRAAARSAAARWGEALRRALARVVAGSSDHWLAERLPEPRRRTLAAHWHPRLELESVAALRWWLRSALYFDLAPAAGEALQPLRYEALVGGDAAPLFGPLGLAPPPGAPPPRVPAPAHDVPIAAAVGALCRELEVRFDEACLGARAGVR